MQSSAKTKTRPTTETQQGRPHAAATGLATTRQTHGTGGGPAIHDASDLMFADSQEVASSRHETKENWPERSANAKPVSRRSGQVRAAWEIRAPGNWLQGRDLNPRPLGYEPSEIPLLRPALKSLRPSFGSLRKLDRCWPVYFIRPRQVIRPVVGKPLHGLFKTGRHEVATAGDVVQFRATIEHNRRDPTTAKPHGLAIQICNLQDLIAHIHAMLMRSFVRIVKRHLSAFIISSSGR